MQGRTLRKYRTIAVLHRALSIEAVGTRPRTCFYQTEPSIVSNSCSSDPTVCVTCGDCLAVAGVIWPRVQALQERITDLERALKDSSKAREQRVRRAPLELRATMAYEMQVQLPSSYTRE